MLQKIPCEILRACSATGIFFMYRTLNRSPRPDRAILVTTRVLNFASVSLAKPYTSILYVMFRVHKFLREHVYYLHNYNFIYHGLAGTLSAALLLPSRYPYTRRRRRRRRRRRHYSSIINGSASPERVKSTRELVTLSPTAFSQHWTSN